MHSGYWEILPYPCLSWKKVRSRDLIRFTLNICLKRFPGDVAPFLRNHNHGHELVRTPHYQSHSDFQWKSHFLLCNEQVICGDSVCFLCHKNSIHQQPPWFSNCWNFCLNWIFPECWKIVIFLILSFFLHLWVRIIL